MMSMEIKQVSKEEGLEIIKTSTPKGSFYSIDNGSYVGIDNTGEELFVEDFETLEACKKWLRYEEDSESNGEEVVKTKPKRLIDYIGERHGVHYANVFDYLKDLQYNSAEHNVNELVNTLLYIEANEAMDDQEEHTER